MEIRAQNLMGSQNAAPAPRTATKDRSPFHRAKAYSATVPKPRPSDDAAVGTADSIASEASSHSSLQPDLAAPRKLVILEQQHVMDQQTVDQIRSLHAHSMLTA